MRALSDASVLVHSNAISVLLQIVLSAFLGRGSAITMATTDYFHSVVYRIDTSCTSALLHWLHGRIVVPDGSTRNQYVCKQDDTSVVLRGVFCTHLKANCWILQVQKGAGQVLCVARLQTDSYPCVDQRFEVLSAEDSPGAILTAFPIANNGSIMARWCPQLVDHYKSLKVKIYEVEMQRKRDSEEHLSALASLTTTVDNMREDVKNSNAKQLQVNESLIERLDAIEKDHRELIALVEEANREDSAGERNRSRDRSRKTVRKSDRCCEKCRVRSLGICTNVFPGMAVYVQGSNSTGLMKMYVTSGRRQNNTLHLSENKDLRTGLRGYFSAKQVKYVVDLCQTCKQKGKR